MTIHDELVFEIHYSEVKIVVALRDAMEDYTTFSVPLTASVERSKTNWGAKEKIVVKRKPAKRARFAGLLPI